MGSNSFFISTTVSPSVSGLLEFSLETYDAGTNISISLEVSGVQASDTEEDLAERIYDSMTVLLSGYAYTGTPVFSDDPFEAEFRVSRTQHIVSIWSQCGYDIKLTSNTTGALVKVSTTAALTTVSRAQELANIKGYPLNGANGVPLTNQDITDLIIKGSLQICSYLRCKVAITTYLNMYRGQDNKSVFTTPTPGISRDNVAVRRKAYINLYTNPTYMTWAFSWNRMTGELNYRPTSVIVNTKSPWDLDNEAQVTFTAGWYVIPEDIVWALTDLNEVNILGYNNIKSLKGGTGEIVFQDSANIYSRILAPIKRFKSKGGKNNNA